MQKTPRAVSNLVRSQVVSAAGMHAQSMRVRVISENVAHADSSSPAPGVDPYRRKIISFSNVYDKELGVQMVEVSKIEPDKSPFHRAHKPNDPAADAQGYVYKTNVNGLVEMMDLREAIQSHDANLRAYQAATAMYSNTVDALKS